MKNKWIYATILLALLATPTPQAPVNNPQHVDEQNLMLGNPAAVYCTDVVGYEYKIVAGPGGGQAGVCILPNDQQCDQWDFYAGTCGQEYDYCAQRGYRTETRSDGQDPFAPRYTVCVSPDGRVMGSITQLSNLSARATGCSDQERPNINFERQPAPDSVASPSTPSSFDWRNNQGYNWLTGVKNQSSCGSCWAFAAVGVTEAHHNIIEDDPGLDLNLAEQDLVSCSSAGSCGGGSSSSAMRYIRDTGIVDESCMPYTASDSSCNKCSDWQSRLTYVDELHGFAPSRSTIRQSVVDYGPIYVYMGIGSDYGGYFSGGIYRCTDDSDINHAVVIVGYSDAGSYWIVRNSWGSTWDGDGYFKVGYGECAIDSTYASYTYLAPPTKASNIQPDGWSGPYTNDATPRFSWNAAYDSGSGMAGYYVAVDDWTPEGGSGNDWWVGNVTAYTVPEAQSDGEHTFAVTSKDQFGNVNPTNTNQQGDAPYYTFYVDTHAPSSAVSALAAEQTQASFLVGWSGSDATSGIASYDVQYRQGAYGVWSDWLSGSGASSATFHARDEGVYYFRSRARDQAGNVESWPSGDGDTYTYVPIIKLYLPLVFRAYDPSQVFYGAVTDDGAPAAGIEVRLRHYDGSTWSTHATAVTDSNGNYRFSNPPNLGADQWLYVRWDNDEYNSDWLWKWICWSVTSSTTDPDARRCNFDLENVDLLSPDPGATVSLPHTFTWRKRALATDAYELNLADTSDNDPYWWNYLGYVGSYTLSGLPDGFAPGQQYGWWMWIYGPNGYGISYYYRNVTFSNAGNSVGIQSSPMSERAPRDEWETISPPQAQ